MSLLFLCYFAMSTGKTKNIVVRRSPRNKGKRAAQQRKSKASVLKSKECDDSSSTEHSLSEEEERMTCNDSTAMEQSSSEEEDMTDGTDGEDYESDSSRKNPDIEHHAIEPREVLQHTVVQFEPIECSNAFVKKSNRVGPPLTVRECNVLAEVFADKIFCELTHPESRKYATQFISKVLTPSAGEPTPEEQIAFKLFLTTVNLFKKRNHEAAFSKFCYRLSFYLVTLSIFLFEQLSNCSFSLHDHLLDN